MIEGLHVVFSSLRKGDSSKPKMPPVRLGGFLLNYITAFTRPPCWVAARRITKSLGFWPEFNMARIVGAPSRLVNVHAQIMRS